MNHAGMTVPCASLRCPVSISWLIRTLTSVESPTTFARIFIGSAISASASAERHLHLLGGHKIFALRSDEREDIARLGHLDARRNRRFSAGWQLEHRREHVGILLDQDRDGLGIG